MRDCACIDCNCEPCVSESCHCLQLGAVVAQASVPNLGALIRQGKKSGLIKPIKAYGG